jgi:RNA-directed DNA polymerase
VARSTATPATRSGGSAAKPRVERLANRARREPHTRYTSRRHHVTGDTLRACGEALDGPKAPGGDGSTTARSGQHLEANLQALPQQWPQRSYRPQPVRRVERPRADGTLRPLGISGLADKRVQERTRRLLDAISEPVCLALSSGVRPGRGCHEALRPLHHEGRRAPVHWRVDMERAQLVDPRPHTERLAVLAERLADQQCLRLSARRRKAGVQTPGGGGPDARGSPQGAMVSPVIAQAFLEQVLDQGCVGGVRHHGPGDGPRLRDADAALAVCETEHDARRVLRVRPWRLGKWGWQRNTQKTPLVAVGKRRAWQVVRGGGRMPTVDGLGVTHDWGRRRSGQARRKRNTSQKRRRRAVGERKQGRRQERSAGNLPALWQAIAQKRRGPCNYGGVTANSRARYLCAGKGPHLVVTWLHRRSPRRRVTGESLRRSFNQHPLPRPGRWVSLIPVWSRAG